MNAKRAAIMRYTAARRALCENSIAEHAAGIEDETPAFLVLNREVWEAEQDVPVWRRWWIDRRVLRELDYWRRMRCVLLAVVLLATLALSGCHLHEPCQGHGGIKGMVGGVIYCRDGS